MKKIKELLSSSDCKVLSTEEKKSLKGGGFWCHCGQDWSKYVDTWAECIEYCNSVDGSI